MDSPLLAEETIEARGLVYRRDGAALLDGASFSLPPAKRTVLMGPNGAGKSLLLRMVQGLLRPDSGEITWGGVRPKTALVLQSPVLLARTARANLLHALRIYGVKRRARGDRADELLAMARLEHRAGTHADVLSGGERQRLAIVRALGAQPELLLLDEPTAQLDPEATAHIEALVNQIHASGTRIVLVTHDIGQAKRLADHVVFLDRGRVAETGPAEGFFARPQSEAARAYLAGRLHF